MRYCFERSLPFICNANFIVNRDGTGSRRLLFGVVSPLKGWSKALVAFRIGFTVSIWSFCSFRFLCFFVLFVFCESAGHLVSLGAFNGTPTVTRSFSSSCTSKTRRVIQANVAHGRPGCVCAAYMYVTPFLPLECFSLHRTSQKC